MIIIWACALLDRAEAALVAVASIARTGTTVHAVSVALRAALICGWLADRCICCREHVCGDVITIYSLLDIIPSYRRFAYMNRQKGVEASDSPPAFAYSPQRSLVAQIYTRCFEVFVCVGPRKSQYCCREARFFFVCPWRAPDWYQARAGASPQYIFNTYVRSVLVFYYAPQPMTCHLDYSIISACCQLEELRATIVPRGGVVVLHMSMSRARKASICCRTDPVFVGPWRA